MVVEGAMSMEEESMGTPESRVLTVFDGTFLTV